MSHLSRLEAPTALSPAHKVPPGVLSGPITSTMFRLALPTIAVLVVQTLVGVAETYFVSSLGTDALAGVTLVFPVLMLMQMMSNGGVGGGVASAIARALGANRHADADAWFGTRSSSPAYSASSSWQRLFSVARFFIEQWAVRNQR